MVEPDERLELVNSKMELIEGSFPAIHQHAIIHALTTEPDEDVALEIFSMIRARIRTGDEIYSVEGYLHDVETLAAIAEMSGQTRVSADLESLHSLFEVHSDALAELLEGYRKQNLLEGLRRNFRNN